MSRFFYCHGIPEVWRWKRVFIVHTNNMRWNPWLLSSFESIKSQGKVSRWKIERKYQKRLQSPYHFLILLRQTYATSELLKLVISQASRFLINSHMFKIFSKVTTHLDIEVRLSCLYLQWRCRTLICKPVCFMNVYNRRSVLNKLFSFAAGTSTTKKKKKKANASGTKS